MGNELNYLLSETEFRKACVGFAKVGMFGIPSMEMADREIEQWKNGNFDNLQDRYILTFIGESTKQFRIAHRKIKVINCDRRMRRGKELVKKITFTLTTGNITLSAHAVSRYRERSGQYVKPNMFWDQLETMPSNFIGRKDLMQPTEDGAWLGGFGWSKQKTLEFTYRKKKLDIDSCDGFHFVAKTWVHVKDMLDFQYDAWKAYRDGDDENAALIMERNINSNQVA